MNKKLVEDLHFIFDEAEAKIGHKIEKILVEMYWQVGYCLRDYPEEEMYMLTKELSILLGIEDKILLNAYYFYKDYPIKKKMGRIGA